MPSLQNAELLAEVAWGTAVGLADGGGRHV